MKSTAKYTTSCIRNARATVLVVLAIMILVGAWHIGGRAVWARAEEETELHCWVLCRPTIGNKPGDYVNLRLWASKNTSSVGFLECGDDFHTDGKTKNGFLHVLDRGEADCWIHAGYVVFEEPVEIFQNYVCVSRGRVAIRKYIDGPQNPVHPWLRTGSEVFVYYIAGDWALTNRGFIQAKYLEAAP